MICDFYIGDAFMIQHSALSQTDYKFVGARKKENGKWEVSVITAIANGYAGGSSTILWEVSDGDKLRVSGNMKGCFIIEGINKQKIKERNISEIMFREIEKDKISIEFIE
jgi:hypothetical protein